MRIIGVMLLLSSLGVAQTTAPAVPVAKVAVIQFQQIVSSTEEGKAAFADLRKQYEPKQKELKDQSDDIESLRKKLQAQSVTMSESARADITKSIDDKTKVLQSSAGDAQKLFQQAMKDTYQKLAEHVYKVMQEYVDKSGYLLVLDASATQSQVLWAAQAIDISQPVLAEYNKKYPVKDTKAGGTIKQDKMDIDKPSVAHQNLSDKSTQ